MDQLIYRSKDVNLLLLINFLLITKRVVLPTLQFRNDISMLQKKNGYNFTNKTSLSIYTLKGGTVPTNSMFFIEKSICETFIGFIVWL